MFSAAPLSFLSHEQTYREVSSSQALRRGLKAAISSDVDEVQSVSWSDEAESTQVSASRYTGWAHYDLAADDLRCFQTDAAPIVTRNALF